MLELLSDLLALSSVVSLCGAFGYLYYQLWVTKNLRPRIAWHYITLVLSTVLLARLITYLHSSDTVPTDEWRLFVRDLVYLQFGFAILVLGYVSSRRRRLDDG